MADSILRASNEYEEPRPPRRGSHRPERVATVASEALNASIYYPAMNEEKPAFRQPLSDASAVIPPIRSLLGPNITREAERQPRARSLFAQDKFYASSSTTTTTTMARHVAPAQEKCNRHPNIPYDDDEDKCTPTRMMTQQQPPAQQARQRVTGTTEQERLRERRARLHHALSERSSSTSTSSVASATTTPSSRLSASAMELIRQMKSSQHSVPITSESILEQYTKTIPLSAACQSVQKRCTYLNCTKISVSRGLCRGHGGGRRCHMPGCTKSAQSRSTFCWAHGGGQRCDVEGCMRSRKSKRFCVAHLHFETADGSTAASPSTATTKTKRDRKKALGTRAPAAVYTADSTDSPATPQYLPSLRQALNTASQSPPNLPPRHPRPLRL